MVCFRTSGTVLLSANVHFFPLIPLFLCSSVESGGIGCGLISEVIEFDSSAVLCVLVDLLETVCGLLAA